MTAATTGIEGRVSEEFTEALARAELEVARIIKYIHEGVKHYNNIKSHEYYVFQPYLVAIKTRRTGGENLRIISVYIPPFKVPIEKEEYFHIAIYLSRERIVKREHFVRRYEYLARNLRHVENSLKQKYSGVPVEHHSFIYFVAWGFRAGAHEEARQTNALYMDKKSNWRVKLVELRYGRSLYEEVVKDLKGT